jgi:hypothetical protein
VVQRSQHQAEVHHEGANRERYHHLRPIAQIFPIRF